MRAPASAGTSRSTCAGNGPGAFFRVEGGGTQSMTAMGRYLFRKRLNKKTKSYCQCRLVSCIVKLLLFNRYIIDTITTFC
jgi:hypothetical protein